MTGIEKQQENVQKLLQLIKENPELRIVPLVDSELVCDSGFAYWAGRWGEAKIDEIYTRDDDERIYIRSEDEERLVDELYDSLDMEEYEDLSDEEIYEMARREVDKYPWEKVIMVYITP